MRFQEITITSLITTYRRSKLNEFQKKTVLLKVNRVGECISPE